MEHYARIISAVEDEGDIAILLRYNLEAEGFRVVTAETGDEAQHAIAEKLPDLILLDYGMPPEISGIELCRRLARPRRNLAHPSDHAHCPRRRRRTRPRPSPPAPTTMS